MLARLQLPAFVLVVTAFVVYGVTPAWAHEQLTVPIGRLPITEGNPPLFDSAAAGAALSGLLIVVALVLLTVLLTYHRVQRAFANALVVALVVFTFESALHSVHHLDDQHDARHCAVASLAGHLTGLAVEGPALDLGIRSAEDHVFLADPTLASDGSLCSHQGRAPPALSL